MKTTDLIYVGLKANVAAFDKKTGAEIWRQQLKGGLGSGERFVTLLVETDRLFAHTKGELFCLDPATGKVLWKNELEGLGYDLASLATTGAWSAPAMAQWKINEQASSGADPGAGGGSSGGQ